MMVYFGMLRQMDRAARLQRAPHDAQILNGLTATDVRQNGLDHSSRAY